MSDKAVNTEYANASLRQRPTAALKGLPGHHALADVDSTYAVIIWTIHEIVT